MEILRSSNEMPAIYTDFDSKFSKDFSEIEWFCEICGGPWANSKPAENWQMGPVHLSRM